MVESWIPLKCVECGEEWESTPRALPAPDSEFDCPYCNARSSVRSFVKTREALDILEGFQR